MKSIDSKLTKLLKITETNDTFHDFAPIKTKEVLQNLEEELEVDPELSRSMINFLKKQHGRVEISDVLEEELLTNFNFDGVKGKDTLKDLFIFKKVFLPALKRNTNIPDGEIFEEVKQNLSKKE